MTIETQIAGALDGRGIEMVIIGGSLSIGGIVTSLTSYI